jgi:hypothetical protein
VRRHFLRVLEGAAVGEAGGNPGGAERVVWQPISAVMPAALARRRIIHQASDWFMARSDSASALWPRAVRSRAARHTARSARKALWRSKILLTQ